VLVKLDSLAAELKGPDYSPTLAAIAQSLQAIEDHPALRMTPQGFGQAMQAASEAAQKRAELEIYGVVQGLNAVAQDLRGQLAGARAPHSQNRPLAMAALAGVAIGAVLWGCLSQPLERVLAPSLAVPDQVAASALNQDRWEAGRRLMQAANPAGFKLFAEGSRLVDNNQSALAKCEAAARRSRKAQRCMVTVPPDPVNTP
jgi:hypothetical protein